MQDAERKQDVRSIRVRFLGRGLALALSVAALLALSIEPAAAREREAGDRQAVPRSPGNGDRAQAAPRGPTRQPRANSGESSGSRGKSSYYDSRTRRRHSGYYGYGYGYSPYYRLYHRHYWPYSPRYYGPYGYSRHYGGTARSLGAVDLNVKPKKTAVYLDGERIGNAGEYDGFPSYLWLEPGDYQLILHREGYETIVRDVRVTSEVVIDIEERLTEGVAMNVEAFPPPPERPAVASASATTITSLVEPGDGEQTLMELDATSEPGRLQLRVEPGDASVYLDGRFLGTGDELSRLQSGVMVDPGSHTLEIVRPGFATETVDFEVESDAQAELVVELRPNVA